MKNTSRKPYIYKVTNLENHQYYIGSQCSGKKIGVNYFTSSTDKDFKEEFKNYRDEKYKIEIIKSFIDPNECVRVENYIIRNYMLKKDGLCLNKFYCCGGEKVFSMVGIHHSEETKQKMRKPHYISPETHERLSAWGKKISIVRKGQSSWNKGLHHTEETKQKMSISLKGIPSPKKGIPLSEETKQKMSIAKKGIPLAEETKQKMSEAHKGIPLSEETKQKISKAHKGHPSPKKGIHLSEETKQKMSIASKNRISISINDTNFCSITGASKYYNVDIKTIRRWLKTGNHNAVYIEKCPKI